MDRKEFIDIITSMSKEEINEYIRANGKIKERKNKAPFYIRDEDGCNKQKN